jgi:hypothetical protein
MVCACNTSYLGDRDQEYQVSRAAGKKLVDPISTNKPGMVVPHIELCRSL